MIPVFAPRSPRTLGATCSTCVDSGWISSLGQYVARFERDFAVLARPPRRGDVERHHGAAPLPGHAGDRAGDEVLVPDLTFVSTANVVRYTGATPVLVDSDPGRGAWTRPRAPEAHRGTRADHPGPPVRTSCRHGPLLRLAATTLGGEDAAEAPRGTLPGAARARLGRLGAFSFYGNKIITTTRADMRDERPGAGRARGVSRDHAMDPRRRYYHRRSASTTA